MPGKAGLPTLHILNKGRFCVLTPARRAVPCILYKERQDMNVLRQLGKKREEMILYGLV